MNGGKETNGQTDNRMRQLGKRVMRMKMRAVMSSEDRILCRSRKDGENEK